jgi:urease accessory protein
MTAGIAADVAPGKDGVLELELERSGGVTRVARQFHRAPLHMYRPIHLDAGRPDMAFLFIQQSGDGLVDGDRYRIDIRCAPRTAVHVTTQAATNVYAARESEVIQVVDLRAEEEAVVEYLPDPLLPFRGARLSQRTCVTADPTATVILGDTLLPGRFARGEVHEYDLIRSETEVHRPDGTLQFADVQELGPGRGEDVRSPAALGDHNVVATLHIVTPRMPAADLVGVLREALAARTEVMAGASELPNGCGAMVRILGMTSAGSRRTMRAVWNAARLELLGVPAPDLRKG